MIAWIVILLKSNDQIPVNDTQEGCYRGTYAFSSIEVDIRGGQLRYNNGRVSLHVIADKYGKASEPDRNIILSENYRAIESQSESAQFFRINPDGSFLMPTDKNRLVTFVPCERGLQ